MINLTIRNIPDEIIKRIKTLSKLERRSLNNEILILLEKGLSSELELKERKFINKELQTEIWKELSGLWKDDRETKEIIKDIYSTRTIGREVKI
ncbi:MAG: FitA-like ribbon-helix-helix domain-containing protein [Brevinematia bacterium]